MVHTIHTSPEELMNLEPGDELVASLPDFPWWKRAWFWMADRLGFSIPKPVPMRVTNVDRDTGTVTFDTGVDITVQARNR